MTLKSPDLLAVLSKLVESNPASPLEVLFFQLKVEQTVDRGPPESDSTEAITSEAPIWIVDAESVLLRCQTSCSLTNPTLGPGLSTEEAAARLVLDGANSLSKLKEESKLKQYLKLFLDPFMVLLMLAGSLAFLGHALDRGERTNLYIGFVLFVVVWASCTFSYVQAGQASKVMASFKRLLPSDCTVIRDGRALRVPAEQIVRGDIVRLGTGDKVPADSWFRGSTKPVSLAHCSISATPVCQRTQD